MSFIVYFAASFHLIPIIVFCCFRKLLRFSKIYFYILALAANSFLADLIGLSLVNFGLNSNLVSNSYDIIERIIATLFLADISLISLRYKKALVLMSVLISLFQICYCFSNRFLTQNDYLNLFSGVYLCLLALYTLNKMTFDSLSVSSKIDINILPVIGFFFFVATMLIPNMITYIDDSVKFPVLFHEVRKGVTVGSNIIRDSLFALFFFQAKKMNYDTGK